MLSLALERYRSSSPVTLARVGYRRGEPARSARLFRHQLGFRRLNGSRTGLFVFEYLPEIAAVYPCPAIVALDEVLSLIGRLTANAAV